MDILAEINSLITQSEGELINLASDDKCSFKRYRKYTTSEIEEYERNWNIQFPPEYKSFLIEVGSCELFIDEYKLGFVFHKLEYVEKYTSEVFLDMHNPFPNLFLIVSLTHRGDEAGFDLSRKTENFSVFSHEDDPEKWIDETDKWVNFFSWLKKLIESNGNKDLPEPVNNFV